MGLIRPTRLLCHLLVVLGLLAGCAERPVANHTRASVRAGYMAQARRVADDAGQASVAAPQFDIPETCRSSERHACLKDEADAEAELRRQWPRFSAAERSVCMLHTTGGVAPSYSELLTCLEIAALVKPKPATVVVGTQE